MMGSMLMLRRVDQRAVMMAFFGCVHAMVIDLCGASAWGFLGFDYGNMPRTFSRTVKITIFSGRSVAPQPVQGIELLQYLLTSLSL